MQSLHDVDDDALNGQETTATTTLAKWTNNGRRGVIIMSRDPEVVGSTAACSTVM